MLHVRIVRVTNCANGHPGSWNLIGISTGASHANHLGCPSAYSNRGSGVKKKSLLYVWYSTTIGRWTAIAQVTSMRGTCGIGTMHPDGEAGDASPASPWAMHGSHPTGWWHIPRSLQPPCIYHRTMHIPWMARQVMECHKSAVSAKPQVGTCLQHCTVYCPSRNATNLNSVVTTHTLMPGGGRQLLVSTWVHMAAARWSRSTTATWRQRCSKGPQAVRVITSCYRCPCLTPWVVVSK